MDSYTNEKGETKVITDLDSHVLIHAIAKYAELEGKASDLVKALKAEAMNRILPTSSTRTALDKSFKEREITTLSLANYNNVVIVPVEIWNETDILSD